MIASPLRALVVEDDPSWGQIISELFMDCGLETDIAATLDEAARILKSHPHCVAVVDLSLSPGNHNNYDGLLVLDAIRRLDPNCRAILLTGYATVEIAVTTLTDYGAFTFLRKENFDREHFREIIQRIPDNAPLPAAPEADPVSVSSFSPQKESASPIIDQNEITAILTEREREVLSLLTQGLTNRGIAERMSITTNTVKHHLKAIFEKLDVHTRSAAIARIIGK